MQEILSKHRQDFGEIRRLCLICHGLDYSTSSFSSSQSRLHLSKSLEASLQNLISSSLLNLAIALRINLYQGILDKKNLELPESSWLYFDEELIDRPATFKQVIDKIIHADTVAKPILPSGMWKGDTKIAIQFKGTEFGKRAWTLNIVLERFAEDVLGLLDEVEAQDA